MLELSNPDWEIGEKRANQSVHQITLTDTQRIVRSFQGLSIDAAVGLIVPGCDAVHRQSGPAMGHFISRNRPLLLLSRLRFFAALALPARFFFVRRPAAMKS
jgi:hypothetical protein